MRAWAAGQGLAVSDRGRVRAEVVRAYEQVHPRD
ncbi:MAG: histone-like nucleoid-structuring protein Lsr2 [Mycobacteriales bacterium]